MRFQIIVKSKRNDDAIAIKTAQLIYEVFNLTNTGLRVHKSQLRLEHLQEEMNILYKELQKFQKNPQSKIVQRTLRGLLSRKSCFASFKRNYVRTHGNQYSELLKYLQ